MRKILTISALFLIVAVVVLAHLFMPPKTSALAAEAIGSLHGPGFGIVALLLLNLVRLSHQPGGAYFKAAAGAMLIALLSEAVQTQGGREAQLTDLLVDAMGTVGFLGTAALFDPAFRLAAGKPRLVILALASIAAVFLTLLPTAWLTGALVARSQAVPTVLSFDQIWERAYSKAEEGELEVVAAPDGWPVTVRKAARIRSAGQLGLMLHVYAYPDWSAYSAVSFVAATLQGETRKIAIGLWGIDAGGGAKADSYYTTTTIGPKPDRYCIAVSALRDRSSGRLFDLAHIHQLLLGATRNESGVEILVGDFRLEKSIDSCPNIRLQKPDDANFGNN